MRIFLSCLFLFIGTGLFAMGASEDPGDMITKHFKLETCKELEIRGQVSFTLTPGDHFEVTAQGNRAVLDQLTVYSVFGQGLVAVDTGLKGPREKGEVHFTITLPSLEKLRVLDRSSGKVEWPAQTPSPQITVSDESSLDLLFNGDNPKIDIDWKSHLSLRGKATTLSLKSKHQSKTDLGQFFLSALYLDLMDGSSLTTGVTGSWGGRLRQASWVGVTQGLPQGNLEVLEGSQVDTPPPENPAATAAPKP